MVLRRSTTDWTWPRLFRRTARSIVAFIIYRPIYDTRAVHYSEPFRLRKWDDDSGGAYFPAFCPTAGPCAALLGIRTASIS